MQLYLYGKSGHNFGLENIRRLSAIYDMLKEFDPILCTADYRAATYAKQYLQVDKGVGVDVIGNLPHAMERGDMLIFDDSKEASPTMKSHMDDFCTNLYEFGKDIPFDIVHNQYFNHTDIKHQKAIFFSDDDYSNYFFNLVKNSSKIDMPLIWGHYFFLKNEDLIRSKFSEIFEEDDYVDMIKSTKYLLTSSVNSCLESIASGNNPVYFKRLDKELIENIELLEKYNIPTISEEKLDSLENIVAEFEKIIQNYPETKAIKQIDISRMKEEIAKTTKLFETIKPSLEYKL